MPFLLDEMGLDKMGLDEMDCMTPGEFNSEGLRVIYKQN